eukprot:429573-Pelagomonas_calceolata.AAC.3
MCLKLCIRGGFPELRPDKAHDPRRMSRSKKRADSIRLHISANFDQTQLHLSLVLHGALAQHWHGHNICAKILTCMNSCACRTDAPDSRVFLAQVINQWNCKMDGPGAGSCNESSNLRELIRANPPSLRA